jgi:hypothetical protein
MLRKLVLLGAAACLPACLLADFSYDESTKITGGALAGMMKFAGAFSKAAREPLQSTVAVKGNRMLHGNKDRATVIDLDAETITEINFQKKTYYVMTFAEMKQRMEQAMEQAKSQKPDANANANPKSDPNVSTNFKMDVKDTGQTRQIAGFDARERILTMSMDATDQQTGNQGGMQIVNDMWIAPHVTGYEEIREFHIRMAKKLSWAPDMGGMFAARPDLARAMATASKETAKLSGVPVLVMMKMTPTSNGQPVTNPSGSDTQSTPQQQSKPSSPSLGDALSGKLGGFGGFGRKKKQQDPPADSSQSSATPAQGADSSGTLMETTTEMSNFSSGPVDPSRFSTPGGFKKVEPEMNRRQRQ